MTKKRSAPLSEEQHATTLPTGAVITIVMAAAILLTIYLLFMARGCNLQPSPTPAPVLYPETVTQPIIPPLEVIPKPVNKYKKDQKSTTCIPDGKTCGAVMTKKDVR
jgi:hypothetical protein